MNRKAITIIALLIATVASVARSATNETPEQAYAALVAASAKGDWGAVYDRLDTPSREQIDMELKRMAAIAARFARGNAELKNLVNLSGRELFIRKSTSEAAENPPVRTDGYNIINSEVKGDRAALTIVVLDALAQATNTHDAATAGHADVTNSHAKATTAGRSRARHQHHHACPGCAHHLREERGKEITNAFTMVKENGEWKVHTLK